MPKGRSKSKAADNQHQKNGESIEQNSQNGEKQIWQDLGEVAMDETRVNKNSKTNVRTRQN